MRTVEHDLELSATGDEDEDGVESQQGMGIFDAAMAMPGAEDAEHLANSPVMHVALSARLGLDPSQMAMYRSDMFPSGETPAMHECLTKQPVNERVLPHVCCMH